MSFMSLAYFSGIQFFSEMRAILSNYFEDCEINAVVLGNILGNCLWRNRR